VRWYESVRNTILKVVGVSTSPLARFNPLLQLLGWLAGKQNVMSVPAVSAQLLLKSLRIV
jgi:hypothetical protein